MAQNIVPSQIPYGVAFEELNRKNARYEKVLRSATRKQVDEEAADLLLEKWLERTKFNGLVQVFLHLHKKGRRVHIRDTHDCVLPGIPMHLPTLLYILEESQASPVDALCEIVLDWAEGHVENLARSMHIEYEIILAMIQRERRIFTEKQDDGGSSQEPSEFLAWCEDLDDSLFYLDDHLLEQETGALLKDAKDRGQSNSEPYDVESSFLNLGGKTVEACADVLTKSEAEKQLSKGDEHVHQEVEMNGVKEQAKQSLSKDLSLSGCPTSTSGATSCPTSTSGAAMGTKSEHPETLPCSEHTANDGTSLKPEKSDNGSPVNTKGKPATKTVIHERNKKQVLKFLHAAIGNLDNVGPVGLKGSSKIPLRGGRKHPSSMASPPPQTPTVHLSSYVQSQYPKTPAHPAYVKPVTDTQKTHSPGKQANSPSSYKLSTVNLMPGFSARDRI